MERYFVIYESCASPNQFQGDFNTYIPETELKQRIAKIIGTGMHPQEVTPKTIEILLHGEPKQKDEWLDFAESLDDGLHHWSAGNGIGYLVETFRKMPRRK